MYNIFPRQVGIPQRKTFHNMKDMLNFINTYNGINRVYAGVYNYTGDEEQDKNIKIDKIYFDLDSEKCFDNIKRMHFWLMEKDLKHIMFFSGKGFHIYIFTKNYDGLKNPKDALYNAHHYIAKEIGLSIGNNETEDVDEHIVGDIARIATMCGTWNTKRRRWCVCIFEEMLSKDYNFIKEYAKTQSTKYKFYGENYLDIKHFDTERPIIMKGFEDEELQMKIDKDEFLKNLPPCLANWLNLEHVGYKRRGYIICYLRDNGYLLSETKEILRKYLSKPEFIHCVSKQVAPGYKEPGEEQLQYFYKPNIIARTSFPSCKKIINMGECPAKKDCKKNNFYA